MLECPVEKGASSDQNFVLFYRACIVPECAPWSDRNLEGAMSENVCICGCGEITRGGRFRPGHDQKLRKAIEDAVGGLESLRSLAEAHVKHPITTNMPE